MTKSDLVYVGHMLEQAKSVTAKVHGKSRPDFDADENLRLALTYLVQTIGESARRVSIPYRQAHPEVPWNKIVGMRNHVVHDYLYVDQDVVWMTATIEVPALVRLLTPLAPSS